MNDTPIQSQPSLFVGHGAPDLLISDIPAKRFLQQLGKQLPTPCGIVVISAHWQSRSLQMTAPTRLETIHDFVGWQPELYDIRYPATGAEWLNQLLASSLEAAGHSVSVGSRPGLDHGAWVPLALMFPEADVPVVQLSLQHRASPEDHYRVGQALAQLRAQGVLVLASGGLVHNLRALKPEGSATDHWAIEFDDWLYQRLSARALPELFDYARQAEHARLAHPTDEHLMPLYVAMGAGGEVAQTQRIHHSFSYANVSMAAYAFAEANLTENLQE